MNKGFDRLMSSRRNYIVSCGYIHIGGGGGNFRNNQTTTGMGLVYIKKNLYLRETTEVFNYCGYTMSKKPFTENNGGQPFYTSHSLKQC